MILLEFEVIGCAWFELWFPSNEDRYLVYCGDRVSISSSPLITRRSATVEMVPLQYPDRTDGCFQILFSDTNFSLTKMSSLPFTSVLKATLVLPSTNEHRLMFVGIHNRSCSDMWGRIFTCREGDSRQIVTTKSFAGEFISIYAVFDFCKVGRPIAVDCHPTSMGFAAACGSINR